ncbi:MAG: trehalose-6-phosphate synthase [Planctomycetes bacterium]|nr:trehalose-6-phosphate synthase [Planctomycetota bacterium]
MSKTWIVSNRLPWTCARDAAGLPHLVRSPGGLVAAMLPVHQAGEASWVGHGGFPADTPGLADLLAGQRLIDVAIAPDIYAAFYNDAANGCLWPIFHYFPALARFDQAGWEAYRSVNQVFAAALLERIGPGDLVWIHDYQLMLLPQLLREALPDLRIGYFHHIPFPASEVFKLLPWREEIAEGLLGADLVGFHTLEYARHFASVAGRLMGLEVRGEDIHHGDRTVRTGAFPLGIDIHGIAEAVRSDRHRETLAELELTFSGRRLVLGVDRLDYTKGIRERLEAFALFLRTHPQARGDTVLLLLCVPSRIEVGPYSDLRQEIEQLVSRINGEYGTTANQPVHYLFQSRGLPELTALYRRADVCLVTPLRDGLNLVCKEYCAVREDLDGMLIISEFAGASEELGEALVVNPFATGEVAAAIHQALHMDPRERRARMSILRRRVLEADNRAWAGQFIAALDAVAAVNRQHASRRLENPAEAGELLARLDGAAQILVAIDGNAFAGRSAQRQELERLMAAVRGRFGDRCAILLISGAEADDAWLGKELWLAGEYGATLQPPGGPLAEQGAALGDLGSHHAEILRILGELERKVPRSRTIAGRATLTWTMGRTTSDMAKVMLNETRHAISLILERSAWFCAGIHRGLAVRCGSCGPARAIERVLAALPGGADATLLTIGDRFTDEAVFNLHRERNCSVAIATPATTADYLVADAHGLAGILIQPGVPS